MGEGVLVSKVCSQCYIYIYAFSRRFYPKRLTILFRLYIFISTCDPWESNPQPFALLTQCSTTEPHRNNVTLGAQHVAEEVRSTVLTETEGILNSKPLGYMSSDIADVDPTTPNILLLGRSDHDLPQIYPESELLSRKRWRYSQVLAGHFWAHLPTSRDIYPNCELEISGWLKLAKPKKTGTVVMIVDHHLPRALWPVGKVSVTVPGSDGNIQTAEVHVGYSE